MIGEGGLELTENEERWICDLMSTEFAPVFRLLQREWCLPMFLVLYTKAVRLNLIVKEMGKQKILWQWSRLSLEMTSLHFVSLREIVIINGVIEQLSVNCQHANTILTATEIRKSSFVKIYILPVSHMCNRKQNSR